MIWFLAPLMALLALLDSGQSSWEARRLLQTVPAHAVVAPGSHVGMEWRCHYGRKICFAGRVYLGEQSWWLVLL